MHKILPANLKCTGVGFGWNIAAALFGGTAPLLSAHFVSKGFMITPSLLVMSYGLHAISTSLSDLKQNIAHLVF